MTKFKTQNVSHLHGLKGLFASPDSIYTCALDIHKTRACAGQYLQGGQDAHSILGLQACNHERCFHCAGQQNGGSGRNGREPASNGTQKVQLPWTSRLAEEALSDASHLTQAGKRQAARLINILSAYAVFDPETGYCQG
jgi:hypothetical protein